MNKLETSELKEKILDLVRLYYTQAHQRKPFVPGKTRITYSGRVYDANELVNLVDASLDFWLTAGPYAFRFESWMRQFFSSTDFLLVNSGSSANLLMISALCSQNLNKTANDSKYAALEPGDEVITPAVTFPTTLTPIIQNRLIPVFVDCEVGTYNINPGLIEDAISPRTHAILIPHTIGNPCDMDTIMDIARRHRLWVLEDSCDALGATFNGQLVGTFGEMASLSFFPAHHITMGEGGGVIINDPRFKQISRSIRDWGRDCWCDPGKNGTCGKRFDWQLGELPYGYDHKYIYSELGYNLKATDMQAAIGMAQVEKMLQFIESRRNNYKHLFDGFKSLEDYLVLPVIDPRSNPSPFGFPITLRPGIDRNGLVKALEDANIETRLVFGGNILRQPGFKNIECRISGTLAGSDTIMANTLFLGVYPALTTEMLDYMIKITRKYFHH